VLTLTRKVGESVIVDGGRIVVKVVEQQGNRIKLSFDAPADVQIQREEVAARTAGTELPPGNAKRFTCLGCFREFETCRDQPTCRACGSKSCRKAVAK